MVFRIQLTPSIAYAERSRHRLDICRPRDAIAAPVIIFFYGGAWQSGYKELYRYVAKALARRGYVAVVPDYRIYPEVCYPDFLDDGALVVRWVKDNIALRRKYFLKATRPVRILRRCCRSIRVGWERSGLIHAATLPA
jgi:acetyl esterase/lipase